MNDFKQAPWKLDYWLVFIQILNYNPAWILILITI